MFLDLIDDCLYLKEGGLKSSHKSQLFFWGFKKKDNFLILKVGKDKEILFKVVNYFANDDTPLTLSQSCNNLLQNIHEERKKFEEIVKAGRLFKDGKYRDKTIKTVLQKVITRKLKNHQLKAAEHLYIVKNGANFSVPGSGKTSVALCVYEKLKSEGKVNTLFVIGPPACFEPWKHEFIETLSRDPSSKILAGGNLL